MDKLVLTACKSDKTKLSNLKNFERTFEELYRNNNFLSRNIILPVSDFWGGSFVAVYCVSGIPQQNPR